MRSEKTRIESTTPATIDHYRVIRRLGGGGMAETFEVVWRGSSGLEGRGCLKLLLDHRVEDPKSRASFAREARIAGSLRHANLVGMMDSNLEAERPYVVFEYVEGLDLRAFRSATVLSPVEVLYVGWKIASALHYAHTYRDEEVRGVLHRDLSPQNVLVSTEGEVKLADFGLAGIQTETAVTVADHVAGTLPYVAPEVVRLEKVSERSDLYSLGVVLYVLAAGRVPYESQNQYALLRKIATGERDGPPLQELAPGYPERFYELVSELLETDPDKRPSSAEEVVRRLAQFGARRRAGRSLGARVRERLAEARLCVDPEATTLEGAVPSTCPTRPRVRRRRPTQLAVVLTIALVVLGSALWTRERRARSEEGVMRPKTAAPLSPEQVEASLLEPPEASARAASKAERSEPVARTEARVPKARKKRKGTLVVVAVPWGNVWIDGRAIGRAPARLRVAPGPHKVQVGDESAGPPRYARVAPGKVTRVILKLQANP